MDQCRECVVLRGGSVREIAAGTRDDLANGVDRLDEFGIVEAGFKMNRDKPGGPPRFVTDQSDLAHGTSFRIRYWQIRSRGNNRMRQGCDRTQEADGR